MRARQLPSAGPPDPRTRPVAAQADPDPTAGAISPRPGSPRRRQTGATARTPGPATDGGPLVLDRYRLQRRLGAGAFGTVWQARDERLHRDVAVKLLPRERIAGGRFEREARAAARLAHPGIVTLYEAAVDEDGAYLVSELVRGSTLDRLLQAGRLSDRDVVSVGVALCDALAHAHGHGVVHRDVKPSNILVPRRPTTPAEVAKLTDFGVARLIGGNPLTRTGDVIGTAAYMAPEQAAGRPAEAAADLYSLSLVIYEALTGVNPLANAPRSRRLGTYLPPLRRQRRELPRALGQAVDLALRPRPRERGSIEELRQGLLLAAQRVDDTAGIVESPRLWRPRSTRADDRGPEPGDSPDRAHGDPSETSVDEDDRAFWRRAWPSRALAGATAAGLTLWLTTHVVAHEPVAPAAAALLAAVLVIALPRVGWLALTAAAPATLAVQHRPGAALIVAIAMLVPVLLLIRSPVDWPLSAIAPALGAVGLAGAWPALAANAHTAWRRCALGFAGWIWISLASPLASKSLYTRASAPPPRHWIHSAAATAAQVLSPQLTAADLSAALLWGLAAMALPLIRNRRARVLNIAAVATWSVGLVVVSRIVAPTILPGEAVIGALAGAVFALAPKLSRARKPTPGATDPAPRLA